MKNLIYSSSVKRIDASSQREIEMMREAIRGEFEPGKYVRDMGVGALSGAAGGAIVGGGVGSLPAAAVGAIGGAAWGLGSNAASDIWYQTRSDEDKASWQAGDLQEHLEKMGSLLTGKTKSPEIGTHLNQLGAQYKNYIDVIIQKTDNEEQKKMYEQNMFNPNTESYKYFKSQYPQRTSNVKFKRVVHAVDTSPAAMVGGLGASVGATKALDMLYPAVAAPGVKGMGAGLVVDLAANWGLDKIDMAMTGGEINMFRRELADVGKIITEVNRLTKNQEDVVYAGNMLWTGLKEVDRMLADIEKKKTESNPDLQASTSGQTSTNTLTPNVTGPIMSSNSSKFKRLG